KHDGGGDPRRSSQTQINQKTKAGDDHELDHRHRPSACTLKESWAEPGHTRFELLPADINRLLAERYMADPPVVLGQLPEHQLVPGPPAGRRVVANGRRHARPSRSRARWKVRSHNVTLSAFCVTTPGVSPPITVSPMTRDGTGCSRRGRSPRCAGQSPRTWS